MAYKYHTQNGSKTFSSNLAPDASNINAIEGKGSRRRQAAKAAAEVAQRWCATFGHKMRYGACLNCGAEAVAA